MFSRNFEHVSFLDNAPSWVRYLKEICTYHFLSFTSSWFHHEFGQEKFGLCGFDKLGILRKGLMLCHGTSGNAYMAIYAYRFKSEQKFLYQALKIQEFVLSRPDISDPEIMVQNYPWVCSKP